MLDIIKAALAVMRSGSAVADPARWKLGQVAANDVATLLSAIIALAVALGYRPPVDASDVAGLAAGIVAVVGIVNRLLTVATTDKIGADYSRADPVPRGTPPAADAAPVFQPVLVRDRREPGVPAELSGAGVQPPQPVDVDPAPLPARRRSRDEPSGFIDPFRDMGGA